MNTDRLGFYRVGFKKFNNKNQMNELINPNNSKIK